MGVKVFTAQLGLNSQNTEGASVHMFYHGADMRLMIWNLYAISVD